MTAFDIGRLNRRIRIERLLPDTALDGAGSGEWELVKTVWAQVQDVLPSRGQTQADLGATMTRPSRVRMRYRAGVTSDMRFVMGGRAMYIVSGPAEIGNRDGLEFMVAEYIPGGNQP